MQPVWLFLISICAGFVGAMSGMGGGVVLIPSLTLLGIDIKHAIAISIVSVIATSSGAASAYVRDHITNLKIGMFLEMFTILGALAGAAITLVSGQRLLTVAFGVVLLASWGALFLQRHEGWRPVAHQDGVSRWLELEGSYYDQATNQNDQLPGQPGLSRRPPDVRGGPGRRPAGNRSGRTEGPDP